MLRVFGLPVLSLDVFGLEYVDEEADAGGGSTHNFERDFSPLSPTEHHEWEWDDRRRFGFG